MIEPWSFLIILLVFITNRGHSQNLASGPKFSSYTIDNTANIYFIKFSQNIIITFDVFWPISKNKLFFEKKL